MELNHSIQLKPMHTHANICHTPTLGANMPSLPITTGLNIVNTTDGNAETNLSTLSTTKQSAAAVSIDPVPANNVCSNNNQTQQIQLQQHQSFSQGQLQTPCARNNNGQAANCQLLQIQFSAPSFSSVNSTGVAGISLGAHGQDVGQILARSSLIPDTNSNLSNGSTASSSLTTSPLPASSSISLLSPLSNPSEIINQGELSSTCSKDSMSQRNMESGGTNYVDLSRASCSNGSAISMKLNSSSTESSFASSFKSSSASNSNGLNGGIGRGFRCQICNRDFTQKGNLKTHLMTHSGERPYECQTCGKNFTQKGNLDTHVKIHTETKDHKCQYCDRGFTQRGNLKTHIRSIHTKEKPFACGQCGKAFSQKGNMLTHYRTHDKEARFPCNVCGKTFSQKGNLRTHQQRHGRGSGR